MSLAVKDIAKSREEAKKLLAEAGHANLKFTLWNRNLAMPYTPAGVFLVDQWKQIGVEVDALDARIDVDEHRRRAEQDRALGRRRRAPSSASRLRSAEIAVVAFGQLAHEFIRVAQAALVQQPAPDPRDTTGDTVLNALAEATLMSAIADVTSVP